MRLILQTNALSAKVIANDVEHILNSLEYQREESSEIVKQCLKQICYIVQLDADKRESEHYTLVQSLQFIIFVYVLNSKQPSILNKYLNEGIYDIGTFINWITNLSIDYLISETLIDIPYKKIIFSGPTKIDLTTKVMKEFPTLQGWYAGHLLKQFYLKRKKL